MHSLTDTRSQRHAFLIMAHNNWYTLEKLLRLIDAPWNDIYLHIDRKAHDFDKGKIQGLLHFSSLHFTKRLNVTWGNESQIKAEMVLFRAAFCNGPYHYYHFLSGSDLPLCTAEELYDFFEDKTCSFLQITDATPFEWRLKNYINVFRQKWIPAALRRRLNILSEIVQYKLHTNRLVWLKARYPRIAKGHNWCDLTQAAVQKLIDAQRDIRRFTRFTHCSDELYKQIILLNFPPEIVGPISDIDIRYVDWCENGDHPRTLTMDDYNRMCMDNITSRKFVFARKFDDHVDREVIDKLFVKLNNRYGRQ